MVPFNTQCELLCTAGSMNVNECCSVRQQGSIDLRVLLVNVRSGSCTRVLCLMRPLPRGPVCGAAELGVAMREHLAAASAAAAAAAGPLERQQVGGSSSETGPLAPEGAAERSGTAALGAPAPACSAAVARQRLGERQAEQQQVRLLVMNRHGAMGMPFVCLRLSSSVHAQHSMLQLPPLDMQPARHTPTPRIHNLVPQALLLRWVEDQEGGAFEALEKAKAQLLSLKVWPFICHFGWCGGFARAP